MTLVIYVFLPDTEIKCENFLEEKIQLRILAIFISLLPSFWVQNLGYIILVPLSNS